MNQPLNLQQVTRQTLLLTGLLSLQFLLRGNLGNVNEIDVLPLAKQFVAPDWVPGDWYLNPSSSYRLLFEFLVGNLIVAIGFLATSIVGRFCCYSLFALGLVLIARKLNLNLVFMLLAVTLFIFNAQGMVAAEWMVRSLEAKSVAYGLVLLAIACLLDRRDRLAALMLGLATSFHVLVGGWAFLTVLAWLLLQQIRSRSQPSSKPQALQQQIKPLISFILLYVGGSVFAIPAVFTQLFTSLSPQSIAPSFIYVYLRLSHHLNPQAWSDTWWLRPIFYLFILISSWSILRAQNSDATSKSTDNSTEVARVTLFELTLLSLIPFGLGVAIAPFDTQGSFLQFYPFRLGDVLLPLNTHLLFACTVQDKLAAIDRKTFSRFCLALLAIIYLAQAPGFQTRLAQLPRFPKLDPDLQTLAQWIRTQTPRNTTIVTPPVELVEFTWLTERPTIAKYKLLAQTKTGILQWYDRLADLSGGKFPLPRHLRTRDNRGDIEAALTRSYDRLNTQQAIDLMTKYQAQYFLAKPKQRLQLSIAYRNSKYILYRQKA